MCLQAFDKLAQYALSWGSSRSALPKPLPTISKPHAYGNGVLTD